MIKLLSKSTYFKPEFHGKESTESQSSQILTRLLIVAKLIFMEEKNRTGQVEKTTVIASYEQCLNSFWTSLGLGPYELRQ